MANGRVRKYIGARYVPIFADPVEWNIDNTYEPLMMVQYRGGTYMSKQYVPADIPLPTVSQGEESNDYWVHMSNWNAQVEGYRKEVLRYAEEVQTFDGRIDDLEDALPIADYSSTNTVAAAIGAVDDKFGSQFTSSNTVSDVIGSGFDSTDTVAASIQDETTARETAVLNEETARKAQDKIRAITFDNVAAMKASSNLENGMFCRTNGFYSAGDGGDAFYEITNTGTANEMDVIACGELYANLIVTKPYICPEVIGSPCDGTQEDTDYLQYLFDNYTIPVKLDGEYVSDQLDINHNYEIFGNGTVNLINDDFCFVMIPANSTISRIRVSGIKLKGSLNFTNFKSRQYNAVFHNMSGSIIRNVIYDGITIEDCAFGIYLNATQGGVFENAIVQNCTFNNMVGKDDGTVSGNGLGVAVGTGHTEPGNIQIVNNHFNLTGRHAIYISNGFGIVCSGNIISNHRNNAYYSESTYTHAISISRCNDCIVNQNVVDHCKAPAFIVNNDGNHDCQNVVFNDNIVYEHLFRYFGGIGTASPETVGTVDNVEMGGNIFYEGNVATNYFIAVSSGKNIKIHDNIFQKKTATNYSRVFDIHMYGDTSYSDRLSINDNICIALGSPCYLVSWNAPASTSSNMQIDIFNNMMEPNMSTQQGSCSSTNFYLNRGMGQMNHESPLANSASLADVITKVNAIINQLINHKMMA